MKETSFVEINGKFYPTVNESGVVANSDIRTYEQKVVDLIRERYTIDQEFAILRQRYTKPDEFAEYNTYCETCKVRAKIPE